MKTIGQKAREAANEKYDWCRGTYFYESAFPAYEEGYEDCAKEQKKEIIDYLEELEAHYRRLGQYDDGKPIRRVIEYIKSMEE